MSVKLRPSTDVMAAIQERWPDKGREWALAVPDELVQLCERFDATPQRTLPARYGFVAVGSTPSGTLVLRASPDPAGRIQADVSTALAVVGAGPAIHEIVTTTTGTWTVVEHIDPATSLDRATLSSDVIAGVVNVLRRLNGHPAPSSVMCRVDDWLRERLNDDCLTDVAPGRGRPSVAERRHALRVLDDLTDRSDHRNLCHGDLHPGNVLVRDDGRLFLIDPRGVMGDVAYDVAVLALKAVGGEPAAARAVGRQLAACVGVNPDRAQAWVRVANVARV